MKTIVKLLAVLALALGTLVVSVPAALAQPNNDTFTGATPASFGFNDSLDTREATTDGDDDQLDVCGFITDASVWYAFTTDTDREVFIDTSGSDYSAGILVGVGSQGSLEAIACGDRAVFFFANSETTYYVLAFDDQFDAGGNGGNLRISFNDPPPPPTLEITVNPSGKFNGKTGIAVVSGTYTCKNGDFINVFGDARQNVGRLSILGFFSVFDSGTCDGEPHSWSSDVFPQNGKFAGGNMMTRSFAFSCNQFTCGEAFVEQLVKLKGSGPAK